LEFEQYRRLQTEQTVAEPTETVPQAHTQADVSVSPQPGPVGWAFDGQDSAQREGADELEQAVSQALLAETAVWSFPSTVNPPVAGIS
jgi:hypothetical protein